MTAIYQFGKPDPQHPAIVVLREAYPGAPLAQNEFFALMVADPGNPKPERFVDWEHAWIGLECSSGKRVYIAKRFSARHKLGRGDTVIVRINATARVCRLDT